MADFPAKRAAAFTCIFPIFDSSGAFLVSAAGLASKVSKDGGAFAATTNLVTETSAGVDGIYTLVLTSTEMTADIVAVKITSTAGKPVFLVMYTSTRQLIDLTYPAVSGRSVNVNASGQVDVATVASGGITNTSFAANAIDSTVLAQTAAQEVADEILNRNLAGGGSGGSRIVRDALRALRNRRAIAAGTLTVYQEDDLSAAWTGAVTTSAGNPVSQIDPA